MEPTCTDVSWSRRGAYLLNSEVFADICVRVGDSSFRCHKIVLASASEFFEKLIANEGLETGEVTLTETNPRVFQIFLDYIYTWKKEPLDKLNCNDLLSLLKSSHVWMAVDVEKTCEKLLLRQLNHQLQPNILIKIFKVAYLLDKKELMSKAIELMKHLPMDQPEIYNMHIDCFTEYFMHNNLLDEGKRFYIAEKWILKNVSPNEESFYPISWSSEPKNSNPVLLLEKVARIFQNIQFERMALDAFYNGPGKSKLLSDSRKFEIIYKIARNIKYNCQNCYHYH